MRHLLLLACFTVAAACGSSTGSPGGEGSDEPPAPIEIDTMEGSDVANSPRDPDAGHVTDGGTTDDGGIDPERDAGTGRQGDGGPGPDPAACRFPDQDEDGVADALENALGSDSLDPDDRPDEEVTILVPFGEPPIPESVEATATAGVARADVAILLDTTGSMLGTTSRIQPALNGLVTALAGEVDDIAFGAAGYGDFPYYDGRNSHYDVPFYVVHRIMTAVTEAGRASLFDAFGFRNIIDGLGPWFSVMRGGDEPEQGWEALRQLATGVGIAYPDANGVPTAVPPFDPATAHPVTPPPGETVGTNGGLGFRDDSLPIVLMITDTTHHDGGDAGTTPVTATQAVAVAELDAIGARVVGLRAWLGASHADLEAIAIATDARVAPDVWGTGPERPANCPVGHCCLDPVGTEADNPPAENGLCTLVFSGDRYDSFLADNMASAIRAIARGARFDVSAVVVDDPTDPVDVRDHFVERVEAVTCGGSSASDTDGDGTPDTFLAAISGTDLCFRVVARSNTSIAQTEEPATYRARLQLLADGHAFMHALDVAFVVPPAVCAVPEQRRCEVDADCATGETCEKEVCRRVLD